MACKNWRGEEYKGDEIEMIGVAESPVCHAYETEKLFFSCVCCVLWDRRSFRHACKPQAFFPCLFFSRVFGFYSSNSLFIRISNPFLPFMPTRTIFFICGPFFLSFGSPVKLPCLPLSYSSLGLFEPSSSSLVAFYSFCYLSLSPRSFFSHSLSLSLATISLCLSLSWHAVLMLSHIHSFIDSQTTGFLPLTFFTCFFSFIVLVFVYILCWDMIKYTCSPFTHFEIN
ncbi:MAG: hypothetical protein JOS17DRAFT_745257, partial [Linnemannia elongata]